MTTRRKALFLLAGAAAAPMVPQRAFAVSTFAGATEFTQIANNIQLLGVGGSTAASAVSAAASAASEAAQLANQILMWQNMIENSLTLPQRLWDQIQSSLGDLWDIATNTQGLSYRQANVDDVIRDRFYTVEEYQQSNLNKAQLSTRISDLNESYQEGIADSFAASGIVSRANEPKLSLLDTLESDLGSIANSEKGLLKAAFQVASMTAETLMGLQEQFARQSALTNEYRAIEKDRENLERAKQEDFLTRRPTISVVPVQ